MLSNKVTEAFKKLPTSVKVGLGIVPLIMFNVATAQAESDLSIMNDVHHHYHTKEKEERIVPEQSYRYGKALKDAGKYSEAASELLKVYRQRPDSEYADDCLGEYLDYVLDDNPNPKSKEWSNKWLELSSKYPNSPWVDRLEPRIENLKDRREQILERERREAQKLSPEEMLEKADLLHDNKEYKKARDLYLDYIRVSDKCNHAYSRLAGTYFRSDIPFDNKVVKAFDKAVEVCPKKDEHWYRELLIDLENYKKNH